MKQCEFPNFQFGQIFNLVNKKFRKIDDRCLSKYNLTHFHAMYLGHLYINGEMNMSELTSVIGVDKANTTRVIRDLLAKGYIEKVGESNRKYDIRLTQSGQEVADEFSSTINKVIKESFKNFTDDEKKEFRRLLTKFFEGVGNVGDI